MKGNTWRRSVVQGKRDAGTWAFRRIRCDAWCEGRMYGLTHCKC